MIDLQKLKVKFISNEAGKQTDVILPIEVFRELIEDLEDLAVIAERRDEGTISHEKMITELNRDGYLPD
jgi:hypothetical protein